MVDGNRAVTAAVLIMTLAAAGCGGGGSGGDGADTLVAEPAERVEFDGYSLLLPENASVTRTAGSGRLVSFESGGRLLIYRIEGDTGLKLQELVDLTLRANSETWPPGDPVTLEVESYKMIRLEGGTGLQVAGSWSGGGESGMMRAVGTRCGGYLYLIESLHPGEWDPVMAAAALSFRCEG